MGGLLGWIVLAAAAVTGVGVIWRNVIHPLIEGIERLGAIPDRLAAVEAKVSMIDQRTKQLEPNGGSSLYDRLGKVEQGQAEMYTELRPMVKTIATLAGPPRRTARTRKGDG